MRDASGTRSVSRHRTRSPGRLPFDDHRRAGDVAWPHRHGEAESELSVLISDGLLVLDLDDDAFPGFDVRHGGREDIWAFLLHKAGSCAVLLRLFVGPLGFVPLLDLSFNHALADLHAQLVDGSGLRQRKDIDSFQPIALARARVREFLCDRRASDGAGHDNLHVRLQDGGRDVPVCPSAPEEQGSLGDIADSHRRNDSGCQCGGRFGGDGRRGRRRQSGKREGHTQHQAGGEPAGSLSMGSITCRKHVILVWSGMMMTRPPDGPGKTADLSRARSDRPLVAGTRVDRGRCGVGFG
jgi:hypothetical protein